MRVLAGALLGIYVSQLVANPLAFALSSKAEVKLAAFLLTLLNLTSTVYLVLPSRELEKASAATALAGLALAPAAYLALCADSGVMPALLAAYALALLIAAVSLVP